MKWSSRPDGIGWSADDSAALRASSDTFQIMEHSRSKKSMRYQIYFLGQPAKPQLISTFDEIYFAARFIVDFFDKEPGLPGNIIKMEINNEME